MRSGFFWGDLPFWQRAKLGWQYIPPLDHSVTIALSVIVAFAASKVINRKIPNKEAAARWASENENRIGWILRESLKRRRLVEISLTNGKSYIGFVIEEDPGGWDQDVALPPVLSGYRSNKTKQLAITKNYAALGQSSLRDYAVVLQLKEVVSICRFDVAAHQRLARQKLTERRV